VVLGVKPPVLKAIGVCPGRRQGDALGDFCNFSLKITHLYEYFGQNSYFKKQLVNLKHLKSSLNVLNRVTEVQSL